MHELEETREDYIERAAEAALSGRPVDTEQAGALRLLLREYYRHTADEDLYRKEPIDAAAAVLSHRQLAAEHEPGQCAVRIFTPTVDEHGWQTGHTVVQVVADDMPFLVDSVTAALTGSDRAIHQVVHPILQVRRDPDGALLEVLGSADQPAASHPKAGPAQPEATQSEAAEPDSARPDSAQPDSAQPALGPTARPESWMYFEIDLVDDPATHRQLAADVRRVLGDVRASVTDWQAMTRRALEVGHGVTEATPPDLRDQAREAGRLLDWLVHDHFTFLGYRRYVLDTGHGEARLGAVPGSGLGILRNDVIPDEQGEVKQSPAFERLPEQTRARAADREVLVLTKANSRSTVHRPAYLDYVGIKTFDEQGNVNGEHRFLGLLSSAAYTGSITTLPVVDRKVEEILERSQISRTSHSGRDLMSFLETYPREELLQTDTDTLYEIATAVMSLQERRRTRVFLRHDRYGRFVTAMVYLPRDRYTTATRLTIADIFTETYGAETVDFAARVSESVLARLHFVIRMPAGTPIPEVDEEELQRRIAQSVRTWDEDFREASTRERGEVEAARLSRQWRVAQAYRADFPGRVAVADLIRLEQAQRTAEQVRRTRKESDGSTPLAGTPVNIYQPVGGDAKERRIKLYRAEPLSLSQVLPYFNNLGIEVIDERPYEFTCEQERTGYIYDFGLRADGLDEQPEGWSHTPRELLTDALEAAWAGRAESDGMDQLVLAAGLTWREVVILRTYVKYFRQIYTTYSQEYVQRTLLANHGIARRLVQLFATLFDPDNDAGADTLARQERAAVVVREITEQLDAVASLDADRILRWILNLVVATVRTNYYQVDEHGQPNAYVSVKVAPERILNLPKPVPAYEIWVYGPRVEGVHIRFGEVARGGLRWSDRPEDFRTEVLGLVKAQTVKNAVIVPTGAKGGFVAKQLPDPADREAWLAEGKRSYQTFIRGLLDITDNLLPGEDGQLTVSPPPRVVRHDGDDTYLVVAADKGTATFSDIANALSQDYHFWLDDAFASGGSAGYDHKEMGITARGAWESVKRHFREMGRDTQTEPFTVVGVGDMSGDVFGNGMLLSGQIRLLAAFDHRHIFLDPDPDPQASFAERQRLFELGRSSWADYDRATISDGGGVFPLSAKRIDLSPQARAALGLGEDVSALTPMELKRAIILAPADLFWNGGIGTYIKASTESHAEVGDKANDAIRVDGKDLRVRVIGEGGNLGATQLGRIEAARHGVRVNTDAIDNSAGVDSSDYEVNIKILLNRVVEDGDLTRKQRNELLAQMTGDVARMVLRHNYEQNVLLGNARKQSAGMLGVHQRLMHLLEAEGGLDRALEFLPDDERMAELRASGGGLTSPEFSVLVAYAKIMLARQIRESDIPDDPWFEKILHRYFPPQLVERYPQRMLNHPLRRQIITTWVANDMVNRGGISFAFRSTEETGVPACVAVRAYVISREVFGLGGFVDQVEALDTKVSTDVQSELYLGMRRLLDRAARWFMHNRSTPLNVAAEIDRFGGPVAQWSGTVDGLLVGAELERHNDMVAELENRGVPHAVANRCAGLLHEFALLDVTELCLAEDRDLTPTAQLYYAVSDRFRMDELLTQVSGLPRGNRWEALARASLRDDLYTVHMELTRMILLSGGEDTDTGNAADAGNLGPRRVQAWEDAHPQVLERVMGTIDAVAGMDGADLAATSVVLRMLRQLIRTSTG